MTTALAHLLEETAIQNQRVYLFGSCSTYGNTSINAEFNREEDDDSSQPAGTSPLDTSNLQPEGAL